MAFKLGVLTLVGASTPKIGLTGFLGVDGVSVPFFVVVGGSFSVVEVEVVVVVVAVSYTHLTLPTICSV